MKQIEKEKNGEIKKEKRDNLGEGDIDREIEKDTLFRDKYVNIKRRQEKKKEHRGKEKNRYRQRE